MHSNPLSNSAKTKAGSTFALAIHGGAGTIARAQMTPKRAARCRAALLAALAAGRRVLAQGGTALDAVTAAIVALEDAPFFNAGRGASFNAAGAIELDAAIMDGANSRAGAVAGVARVKNPILAARLVMERTPHVLIVGPAADRLARRHGLATVAPEYFVTANARRAYAREKARRRKERAARAAKHGTVGAVALDAHGNLAAGTSTGGYAHKAAGRVGDSPVVGAGTYAANGVCAVSCTGWGEYFLRALVAYDVAARMRYLGRPLARAATEALAAAARLGGSGGLIALDARGRVAMPFDTGGMYRGFVARGARPRVAIYD